MTTERKCGCLQQSYPTHRQEGGGGVTQRPSEALDPSKTKEQLFRNITDGLTAVAAHSLPQLREVTVTHRLRHPQSPKHCVVCVLI